MISEPDTNAKELINGLISRLVKIYQTLDPDETVEESMADAREVILTKGLTRSKEMIERLEESILR